MEKFKKLVIVCFIFELIILAHGMFTGLYDDSMVVIAVKNLFAN